MTFTLTINGELDEKRLAAIASILAGGSVPSTVSTPQASVSPATPSGTSQAPADSVSAAQKPTRGKATKPDAAVEPVAPADPVVPVVSTEPPSGSKTVEDVKTLVVARCSPTSENKLEVKHCMNLVRGIVGPDIIIKKLDDIPTHYADQCYAAIEQA